MTIQPRPEMSNFDDALQALREALMENESLALVNKAAFDEVAASSDYEASEEAPEIRALKVPRQLFDALEISLKVQIRFAQACWDAFDKVEITRRSIDI